MGKMIKKYRLSVEFVYYAAKELEISDEDYKRMEEKGVYPTDPLYSEITNLDEAALDDCPVHKVELEEIS
jgi:hypothetical protein